ncbi:MAG: hypothetical protein ACKVOP_00455 [Sphingomonadaceae bacterium]
MRALAVSGMALLCMGQAAPVAPKPIRIGVAGPELDTCPSSGRVTGTNPRGDHFLNVRAAPDVHAKVLHRLKPTGSVTICDRSPDGKWLGVIYGDIDILGLREEDVLDAGDGGDCYDNTPLKRPQIYRGPCKSGWVSARFVEIIAG